MPATSLAHAVSGPRGSRARVLLERHGLLSVIEAILDPAMLVLSLWAVSFRVEGDLLSPYVILSIIAFAIAFPGTSYLQTSTWRMASGILASWVFIVGLLVLLGVATDTFGEFSRSALITWLWAAPLCQVGARLALRTATPWLARLEGPPQKAVIVGRNRQAAALAAALESSAYSRIEVTGFFDDRGFDRVEGRPHAPCGKLPDLARFVKDHRVQRIYLSLPMTAQPRILEVLDALKDTTASIFFVPDMFVTDLIQGHSESVCGVPVISVCDTPFRATDGIVKSVSDFVLALLILILISPLLLVIAAAVKLTSPGPAIFKQRRYGLDGEEILVYKFRSMTVCEDGGSIQQARKGDSRVTKVGAFLRKTSLDELPQFINVLQGRMSIVGPRPHAVAHNELYRSLIKGYMIRHKVKPGITGWAQVNGFRGETDTLEKMQSRIDFDLDYLRHWSLRLDLYIILKTVLVVFRDRAAY